MSRTNSNKKRELSMDETAAAGHLKAIWLANKRRLGLTQESLGRQYRARDGKSITQGAVGHYLNGVTPLNAWACLEFSRILQCDVIDFAPTQIIEELKALGNKDEASDYFKVFYYKTSPGETPDDTIITLPVSWAARREVPINMITAVECIDDDMCDQGLTRGSTVLIRRDRTTIESGKIYAIDFRDRILIRRAFRQSQSTIVFTAGSKYSAPEIVRVGDLDRIVVIGEATQALIDLN